MVWLRRAHLVATWAFTAGVIFQVFLAGLGVFESSSRFGTHAGWGFLLGIGILVLLVLAGISAAGQRQVYYALGLLGLFFVQSILVAFRDSAPTIAALHPVNGFAILFVSIAMAREAWRDRNRRLVTPISPQPAEGAAGS